MIDALDAAGFVRNIDDERHRDDRREDLRVTDLDAPEWEALVEVKGYRGGAAVTDLAKLHRWQSYYVAEAGKQPAALWHIVNHFRHGDPTTRLPVLPNDRDLDNLASENGVVIDTRDLFKRTFGLGDDALTQRRSCGLRCGLPEASLAMWAERRRRRSPTTTTRTLIRPRWAKCFGCTFDPVAR